MTRHISIRFVVMLAAALLVVTNTLIASAQGDTTPVVTLRGRAVLPADTFADGPASGAKIDPTSNLNGRKAPFKSQPVQGFSGVLPAGNGNWLFLSDNGYGAKANSADFNLRFHEVKIDFDKGSVELVRFVELSDPDKQVPFPITNNDSKERILTGSDFDLESFRKASDGTFWFGDELGPYLLHTDANGKLLEAPIPTPFPAIFAPYAKGLKFVQSPDHPDFVTLADAAARTAAANHRSSRGFEGMAINAGGTALYPLLEGAMTLDPLQQRLTIQEFDLKTKAYTGKFWFYPLSNPAHAIGDMTAINDNEYLVIERDGGEGEKAVFKRIYKIDLSKAAPDNVLQKTLVADLMAIKDDKALTKTEQGAIGLGEKFTFPFTTIESVYPIDESTLLVANDNNYPFSAGRRPGVSDDNEIILITLPEKLTVTAK
jgi:hypothetical protein